MHIDLGQIHSEGRDESGSNKVKFEESKGDIDFGADGFQPMSAYNSTNNRCHGRIKQAQSTKHESERNNKDREKSD